MKNWEVLIESSFDAGLHEDVARYAVLAALEAEDMECNGEVSVSFVNDDEMKNLNYEYRFINETTDCLSFPQYSKEELAGIRVRGGFVHLGDIVISLDRAYQQAAEYGFGIDREVAFLTIHSLLHLLGYDHDDTEGEKIMFDYQEVILAKMGLGRNDD